MAIITISRGSLSGGRAVAECLAEHLGVPCVAREILQEAALSLGVSEQAMHEEFETTPGRWARLHQERETYLLAVRSALADRCVDGRLVYHGLAGQFLLRGVRGVLSVRLIAPLELRIQALVKQHHRMSGAAGQEFIANVDEERRRWVRELYGEDVEDPSLYDLTVKLRAMSLDTACTAIAEAAAQSEYEVTAEVKAGLEAFAATCRQALETRMARA
ncbi:MAG TPA: cytidylate kinase-like family protein [Longimicrobiales bacterium]|nr:cytidylate kinase-like family protein [Longimicrobiales bacterium]